MNRSNRRPLADRIRPPHNRALGLIVAVCLLCSLQARPIAGSRARPDPPDGCCRRLERLTFERINQERNLRGLSRLRLDGHLTKSARWHSQDMRDRRFFDHVNPDGYSPLERSVLAGLRRARRVSENLGISYGMGDPVSSVVEGWLRSPGHRRNMLDPKARYTGVGVARTPQGVLYFTQVFADRL